MITPEESPSKLDFASMEQKNKLLQYVIFIALILGIIFGLGFFIAPDSSHAPKIAKREKHGSAEQHSEKTNHGEQAPIKIDRSVEPKFKTNYKSLPISKTAGEQVKPESPSEEMTNDQAEEKISLEDQPTIDKSLEDENYFTELSKKYKSEVLDPLGVGRIRKDIIIRYYTHQPDGNKVYSLEKLGFYIHERPVEGILLEDESNAIYYGDNVKMEELQLVVYTLIKAGLPIKTVELSQFHDGWKSSSIEIGTDTTINERSVLSIEEIKHIGE